jgi:hypothetical protein
MPRPSPYQAFVLGLLLTLLAPATTRSQDAYPPPPPCTCPPNVNPADVGPEGTHGNEPDDFEFEGFPDPFGAQQVQGVEPHDFEFDHPVE